MLETVLTVAIQVVGLLPARFVTGVVHFWMDRYGREDMPIVGKAVIEINTWHQENPRKMTTGVTGTSVKVPGLESHLCYWLFI